jgi:transposase
MYYSGIDLHKRFCFITTVDENGRIIKQEKLKNNQFQILNYFHSIKGQHKATVESTSGWYWISDLLTNDGIPLILAHAKYLKAIAYAKVKTDKVDSMILAQLLRMDFIPPAHQIDAKMRGVRDLMRNRLRLVYKQTSCANSIHRLLEKFNLDSPEDLSELYYLQYKFHDAQFQLVEQQIKQLEKRLYPILIPNDDVQRVLWVPGFGKINSFTLLTEVDGIERFSTDKQFFSYSRLVPGAKDSGGKVRHNRAEAKAGNKYLKIIFTEAAIRAVQYYPEIRQFYNRLLRKKNKRIAYTIVAKELARIVYHVLKNRTEFNGCFKGRKLSRVKSLQWPRLSSPQA